MARILVVEDEPGIALGLEDDLQLEGYDVDVVDDGNHALARAQSESYDLILLDVMLPGKDGFEICRTLRRGGDRTPIILLTAKTHEAEKVLGLELGADDYITKPFSPLELRARIKAVLRRSENDLPDVYRFGDCEVDFHRLAVRCEGKPVALTSLEFKLLAAFIRNRGHVLSRAQLLDLVWGPEVVLTDRVVDTHITNLRKKIEADPSRPRYVMGVRGVGYRFDG